MLIIIYNLTIRRTTSIPHHYILTWATPAWTMTMCAPRLALYLAPRAPAIALSRGAGRGHLHASVTYVVGIFEQCNELIHLILQHSENIILSLLYRFQNNNFFQLFSTFNFCFVIFADLFEDR